MKMKRSLVHICSIFSIFILIFFNSSCKKDEPVTPSTKSNLKIGYKPHVIFVNNNNSGNTFLKGSNGSSFLNGGNGNTFPSGGSSGNNFPAGGSSGTTFPGN